MTIPAAAKTLIETWRLGFIATADAEGHPNVSPKGTFVVIDHQTIAFAEMRSPSTARNIAARPEVEVNFVDVLSRRGVRLRGRALFIAKGAAEYDALLPAFTEHWADLEPMFNGIVVIAVTACRPLQSPAYESGAEESALRDHWAAKIAGLHREGGEPA